jgi:hypothetical protein
MEPVEQFHLKDLPNAAVFEPREFLEGEKVLFLRDQQPEAMPRDIGHSTAEVLLPGSDGFILPLHNDFRGLGTIVVCSLYIDGAMVIFRPEDADICPTADARVRDKLVARVNIARQLRATVAYRKSSSKARPVVGSVVVSVWAGFLDLS